MFPVPHKNRNFNWHNLIITHVAKYQALIEKRTRDIKIDTDEFRSATWSLAEQMRVSRATGTTPVADGEDRFGHTAVKKRGARCR